ncbi:MAG: hypothetical protein ACREJP_05460 [Candidatus Methylomirabilales bacterium]
MNLAPLSPLLNAVLIFLVTQGTSVTRETVRGVESGINQGLDGVRDRVGTEASLLGDSLSEVIGTIEAGSAEVTSGQRAAQDRLGTLLARLRALEDQRRLPGPPGPGGPPGAPQPPVTMVTGTTTTTTTTTATVTTTTRCTLKVDRIGVGCS